jgi:hypothetical protein
LQTTCKATFQITRFGKPISEVPLSNLIQTSIEFEHVPGCVPTFLEVEACNTANYTYWDTWQKLSADQQAFHIAHLIAERWVNSHKSDAENRAMKKK